jgi:hypothetical protein
VCFFLLYFRHHPHPPPRETETKPKLSSQHTHTHTHTRQSEQATADRVSHCTAPHRTDCTTTPSAQSLHMNRNQTSKGPGSRKH